MIAIACCRGSARLRATPFSAPSTLAAEKLEVSHPGIGNRRCRGKTMAVYSARKEVRHMDRAEVDGMTLEYEESGSGDPVVFIHGAHMGDTYRPLMAEPALKNYKLIGYHRRGYAGSSKPAGAVSISTHAADCLALLRKLDA